MTEEEPSILNMVRAKADGRWGLGQGSRRSGVSRVPPGGAQERPPGPCEGSNMEGNMEAGVATAPSAWRTPWREEFS